MGTPKNLSVQKAFALLRAFRGSDEWVSNAELSRRARLSKASAHRLMRTLEEIGAVVRDSRGCYRPGMVLASLSKNIAIGDLVRVTAEEALTDLAARLKGIVHVGVLEHGMVTYAAKIGDPIGVPVPSRVGAQLEPYCSALGKVLLSGLPDAQLDEFLRDGKLIALTPQTITDRSRLRAEIETVRQRGYAIDDREVDQTVCCIGAPVRDPNGQTVAAISMADSAAHMGPGWRDEISAALISAAATISRKVYPSHAILAN
jgi:DNA-binding IclR family transcriptional regulator